MWTWVMLCAVFGYLAVRLAAFIFHGRRFRVVAEGVCERSIHIHLEYSSRLRPTRKSSGSGKKKICGTAIMFQDGTFAMVRDLHSNFCEKGDRVRISANRFGKVRTEITKDPAG